MEGPVLSALMLALMLTVLLSLLELTLRVKSLSWMKSLMKRE
jgi:hypothetical protein